MKKKSDLYIRLILEIDNRYVFNQSFENVYTLPEKALDIIDI
tara:strand:- start:245 stop:370 length:126 start_codon:yes stop_codon:yes gene_type:complete